MNLKFELQFFGYSMPLLYEVFLLCVFFRVQSMIQNDFASQEDHGKGNNREQQWKKRNIICVYIEYKLQQHVQLI